MNKSLKYKNEITRDFVSIRSSPSYGLSTPCRGSRVRLFRLGQLIIKLKTEQILATRVTYGSQMRENETGKFSKHYLIAGRITFTGKSKHKLHRYVLLLTHNDFRIIIEVSESV